jgi:NAD(P)-dependent dehydrogenase (short-subunit alcohol dehydrogenase family)
MTVLVAGGTGALGGAVVRELLAAGYDCTLTWIVDAERERVEAELGGRVALVRANLVEPEGGAEAAVAASGELEAVVDLVGGFSAGTLVHETHPDEFLRMMQLNVAPAFLLARAAMPQLVQHGGGAFVGVSARAALQPFAGAAGYAASKAALLALIRALDVEYRDRGVRCNAILPSVIDTPANRAASPDADHSRWVAPEAIAKVVRFLVSDESAPTTGAAIPVYGLA